jgi:hypothetical protein
MVVAKVMGFEQDNCSLILGRDSVVILFIILSRIAPIAYPLTYYWAQWNLSLPGHKYRGLYLSRYIHKSIMLCLI